MSEKFERYDDGTYSLYAGKGYAENVDLLANCEDTGNGYIFFFPSYVSTHRPNYICMDYDEAAYILKMLKKINKLTCALDD